MPKILIIEDEEQAVSALLADISRYCPELDIVGTAGSVEKSIKLIKETNPELIFLDIQLDDGEGFEILDNVISIRIMLK